MAKKKGDNKIKVKVKKTVKKDEREKKQKEAKTVEELNNLKKAEINKKKEKIILSKQDEGIERDKRLMMWAGVSFFMVLILAGWVLNIKSIFKKTESIKDNPGQFEWSKITNEVNQTMEQIKKGLEELKQVSVMDNISSTTEDMNSSLPKNENNESLSVDQLRGEDSIAELKDRLKELKESLDNKN